MRLTVSKPGRTISEFRFARGPVYIGRHSHSQVFLPEKAWAALAWRIPGVGYLSYNLWQRRALRAARQLHAQVRFDLVHHVNILGFREPGYLWKLDAPFIWGPVGGTQNYPWRNLSQAGLIGGVREVLRNLVNGLQLRFSRRVHRAARLRLVPEDAAPVGPRIEDVAEPPVLHAAHRVVAPARRLMELGEDELAAVLRPPA